MAIHALKLCGLKENLIYEAIKKLKDVDGRLELVKKFSNNVKVFVDYAHTPDALLKTIQSIKKEYGENLSLVFGCGGERDKKKRPLMAKIANKNCKKIYLTDDNPRNEIPKKIRNELSKYISKDKVLNIGNRTLAIRKAIQNASTNEIILIAGKGHEQHQIYKNKIIKTSDKKIVQRMNVKIKTINKKKQNYLQNQLIFSETLGNKKFVNFKGFSIDTRSIKLDNLFLAIKSKKNDGNKFIGNALKKGAGCIVTSSIIKNKYRSKKIIKIKNTYSFLNKFAQLKRKHSLAKIIAITGSAGKTSLKNLINDLLKNFGNTYSSPKSFNNHLGVPISLSNLNFDTEFGIFEVGMSRSGEIKNLTRLIKPHIGVITNIGEAHIENFKNVNGIAKAKSEIIEGVMKGGKIILNRDDKFFSLSVKKAHAYKLKICTFGKHKESDIRLKKILSKGSRSRLFIKINNQTIDFEVKDLNLYNVLSSIAVLSELNLDVFKIIKKI